MSARTDPASWDEYLEQWRDRHGLTVKVGSPCGNQVYRWTGDPLQLRTETKGLFASGRVYGFDPGFVRGEGVQNAVGRGYNRTPAPAPTSLCEAGPGFCYHFCNDLPFILLPVSEPNTILVGPLWVARALDALVALDIPRVGEACIHWSAAARFSQWVRNEVDFAALSGVDALAGSEALEQALAGLTAEPVTPR